MPKFPKCVSQHELFMSCRAAVGNASLAHTLAECLYWFQHAKKQIDGKPAIWKSGPELAKALGIAPKTANAHLKRLASLGFWQLKYLPRPYHPSPVTWLVLGAASEEIVRARRTALAMPADQGASDGAVDGVVDGASIQPITHVQSSQKGTLKHNIPSLLHETNPQGEFIPEKGCSPDSKNELPKKQKVPGEKAPWYSKVLPEVEELVDTIQHQLSLHSMPEWDTSSQFTWKHAETLWKELGDAGVATPSGQTEFVSAILERWPQLRNLMGHRYRNHEGNYLRPTPMALAREFSLLNSALLSPPPAQKSSGGFDFNLDLTPAN